MIAACEGLIYAHKAGLDLQQLMPVITKGTSSSFLLQHMGAKCLKKDFTPGIYIELFIKDLMIALNEVRRLHVSLPVFGVTAQLFQMVETLGIEGISAHAVFCILEKINGTEVKKYDF